MGYVSYRKSNRLKSLDLRLQLRKEECTAKLELTSLGELIERANTSRQRVAAAMGVSRSSLMDKWKVRVDEDKAILADMLMRAPNNDDNYEVMGEKELESRLVKVHELRKKIDRLLDSYNNELKYDEKSRESIRAARNK